MKSCTLIIVIWSLVISNAFTHPSFTTKVSRIDGLPWRLIEGGALAKTPNPDRAVDLAPAFKEMGCNIKEGNTIIYAAGILIRHLDDDSHKIVDEIIETIYRSDNLLATCRAYYELLEPLSSENRLRTVMRIGFLPDPLVASMINEIQRIKPASDSNLNPKQLSAKEVEKIRRLEIATSSILDIAIGRLKSQVSAMDLLKSEQAADGKTPEAPQPPH